MRRRHRTGWGQITALPFDASREPRSHVRVMRINAPEGLEAFIATFAPGFDVDGNQITWPLPLDYKDGSRRLIEQVTLGTLSLEGDRYVVRLPE